MNRLQQFSVEWGTALCLISLVLWLPYIGALPKMIGIIFLATVFYAFGVIFRMWLEGKMEAYDDSD